MWRPTHSIYGVCIYSAICGVVTFYYHAYDKALSISVEQDRILILILVCVYSAIFSFCHNIPVVATNIGTKINKLHSVYKQI